MLPQRLRRMGDRLKASSSWWNGARPRSMPAPLRIELTLTARAEARAAFDRPRDAETRLRCQLVLLAGDGLTAPQIAPLVQRSATTVQRGLHRSHDGGMVAVP